jgi:peroxiredoxin
MKKRKKNTLKPLQPSQKRARALLPGDHAPMFLAPSNVNPSFDFSTAAGRYVILSFIGSGVEGADAVVASAWLARETLFHDPSRYLFLVAADAAEQGHAELRKNRGGMDVFWDRDRRIASLYGVVIEESGPITFIFDPNFRVIAILRGESQVEAAVGIIKNLPAFGPAVRMPIPVFAPVLTVPFVFEPELCRHLIEGWNRDGGNDSGFMTEREGKTVLVVDHKHKRRSDWLVEDPALQALLRSRIHERIVPELKKAFQYESTRMERFLVARYDGETGGFFRAHRDNTTKGTAHRRFAVTINLNAEEFEGGELMFPEYGRITYKAQTGGAIVFSCSLLHEALPVRSGLRYAFLPFLYDDAAAEIREANNRYLGEGVQRYSAR